MTQEKGIPYQRHKPSAALREFLDPLDPGSYFDCGRARLRGLDDALLAEARSRGRAIGDDSFQLVATDMGVIYCRPSISFAIAARWDDVVIVRPRGDDPVVLVVTWPTHGELKFTLSKRLAGNIFRRWLQLRVQTDRVRRSVETVESEEAVPATDAPPRPGVTTSEKVAGQPRERIGHQVQGKDRVAATVAEAAAVVRRPKQEGSASSVDNVAVARVARAKAAAVKAMDDDAPVVRTPAAVSASGGTVAARRRRNPDKLDVDVDDGGPETWELVSKVKAPKRKDAEPGRQTAKVDRRQNPDALRRKRQAKAGGPRRRRPSNGQPSQRSSRSRWFADLELTAKQGVPVYEIPPLQSPDPERPMRAQTQARTVPTGSAKSTAPPGPSNSIKSKASQDPPPVDADKPTGPDLPAQEANSWTIEPAAEAEKAEAKTKETELAPTVEAELPRATSGEFETTEVTEIVEAGDLVVETEQNPAVKNRHLSEPAAARPSAADFVDQVVASAEPLERQPVPAVTGDHRATEAPSSLPSVLVMKRPTQPKPSWIGSPVSLVAAMVVISTFVLIGAVAVGSYRRSAEVAAGVNPAGPAVSIIDHQRFRQAGNNDLTASDLGQPEAARYSETTAPPPTVGSGSAPITSIPDWPPQDGPQTCNSNYSGCVPDVGDVDCPNDGDGPIYWSESAMVMGEDVYQLDTDGDGEICEPDQPPLVPAADPADVDASETDASGAGADG